MSNIRNIKRYILKTVCVIMLVLIQFDVCGYDLIHALQLTGEPVNEYPTSDLCVDEENGMASQWDNPVYRGVNPRNIFRIPVVEFPTFNFLLQIRELTFGLCNGLQLQAYLSNVFYLKYCVLLI